MTETSPTSTPTVRDRLKMGLARMLAPLLSLNDPQWGRRPGGGNQGPPDLDEIWRNLNRKLNRLLGGKGGGSGNSETPGGGPSAGAMGGGAGLLAALIVVVWVA